MSKANSRPTSEPEESDKITLPVDKNQNDTDAAGESKSARKKLVLGQTPAFVHSVSEP